MEDGFGVAGTLAAVERDDGDFVTGGGAALVAEDGDAAVVVDVVWCGRGFLLMEWGWLVLVRKSICCCRC